jgi:hypothetical protein
MKIHFTVLVTSVTRDFGRKGIVRSRRRAASLGFGRTMRNADGNAVSKHPQMTTTRGAHQPTKTFG